MGWKRRRRPRTLRCGTNWSFSFLPAEQRGQVSGTTSHSAPIWLLPKTFLFFSCVHVCQHIKHEFSFIQPSIFFSPPPPFIDLNTVTLKGPQKCGSTKQALNPSFTSEGRPRPWMVAFSTQRWQPSLALLPGGLNLSGTEGSAKKEKISNRLGQVNFLALSTLHICLPHHLHLRHHHRHHVSLWPSRLLASRGSMWWGEKR